MITRRTLPAAPVVKPTVEVVTCSTCGDGETLGMLPEEDARAFEARHAKCAKERR